MTKEQLISFATLILNWNRMPDEITIGIVGEPKVIMVRYNNLWIGIETDGYTHS